MLYRIKISVAKWVSNAERIVVSVYDFNIMGIGSIQSISGFVGVEKRA